MPSFANTMKMGLAALKSSDAAMKHMIIISDGDPAPPPPKLVSGFIAAKVSVSMVAINPHGGQEIPAMRAIARSTGGRYYYPKTPNRLPAIFIKEAKTLKRSMIQNQRFQPQVEFPSPVLKGVETLPDLFGYVLVTPKARALTVLKGPETEQIDPILAIWRYGLGKSAAFTSDLSPNWGRKWVEWDHYQAFVHQLLTDISRVKRKGNLHLSIFASGAKGMISVEDYYREESFLELKARVVGPRGQTVTVSLKQVAPRRYQAEFPLWGKGRYQVITAGAGAGRNEQVTGGLTVPYSPEYLRFRSNPLVLEKIAAAPIGLVFFFSTNPNVKDLGEFMMGVTLYFLLPLELAYHISRTFSEEVKWKTLSGLMILPISLRRLFWTKILSCLLALAPSLACLFLGACLAPTSAGEALWLLLSEPKALAALALVVICYLCFLSLVVYLSLVLKWGALAVAIGISFIWMMVLQIALWLLFMMLGFLLGGLSGWVMILVMSAVHFTLALIIYRLTLGRLAQAGAE